VSRLGLDCLGICLLGADAPSLDDVRAGRGTLKKGMKGAAVEYVQAIAGAIADGDFGPATEDAVKKFQSSNGLAADGVVGAQTLAALDKLAGGGTKGVEKISLVDQAPSAPAKAAASTASPASVKVPAAGVIAATLEQPKPVSVGTYVAYGLGAVAVGGIIYAVLNR
jgi:peptidoglycan hydrolase-like protein with peptidoglycan-binding domain